MQLINGQLNLYNGLNTSGSTTITGSVNITGSVTATSFTGSLFGTASFALNGSSNAIMYQTASAASVWTFNHFLATPYPVITVYDNNNSVIIPQSITSVDSSSLTITFSSARTGVAVASKGGYVGSTVGTATTANALTTARLINGTSFDGTQNITIPNLVSGSSQISLAGTSDYSGLFGGIGASTSSINAFTSSHNIWSSSVATTGSNTFIGNQTITGSLFVSGTILQNGGGLALQDGTILYHSSSTWFIPTSTVSTSGTTATSVGTQFTSGMVGAKLTILRESKIITAFTSNTQVTVDSAYSQNYSSIPSGSWGVYSKAFEIKADSTIGYYDKTGTFVFGKRSDSNVLAQNLLSSTSDSFYLTQNRFALNSGFTVDWTNLQGTGTRDVGIRRNTTGSLEIYDGNTVDGAIANRRDLILRNITGSNAFFSGSTTITGSLGVSGSVTATSFIGSIGATNGVVSGSSQVSIAGTSDYSSLFGGIALATSSLNSFTASNANTSLNTYTGSNDTTNTTQNNRLTNLETTSASVNISVSNINSFTSSAGIRLTNLESTSASVNGHIADINSKTGSYARTNSANTFNGTQIVSGSLFVTQDLVILGSSSIQNISSSNVTIGSAYITLNTFTPASRFAGINIVDSGSAGSSGSLLYDAIDDEFVFVHKGNGTNVTSSHFLMGPETYDNLGNETYLTKNRITKVGNYEHLADSNISDTGTEISLNSLTSVTGSFVVTGGITGSIRATNGIVSGSSQISIAGTSDYTSLFTGIASATASLNTFSASVNGRIADINTKTGSFETKFTTLASVSASLNQFTASAAIRLTNLETTSASVNISVTNLNTYSASVSNSIQQLSLKTGSYATTGSNSFIGNQTISGSLSIGSASVSTENTLIVGVSPAGGTGEGGQILLAASGGLYTSASMLDNYQNKFRLLRGTNAGSDGVKLAVDMGTGQVQFPNYNSSTAFVGSAVGYLAVDNNGNILTTTPGTTDLTQLNSFTASTAPRLTNLETTSASVSNSIQQLNSFTASNANTSLNTYTSSISDPKFVQIGASTSSLNLFTASAAIRLTNLETTTASLNISVTNLNTYSASVSNSIQQLSLKTGSYATTGSNSFNGNQIITGSLTVTSLTTIATSLTTNSSSFVLTSGSNLIIQNNGLAEITGSLRVSGSQIVTGSVTATSFTGSLLGTASFATSASYALNGSSNAVLYQTASAASVWTFNHFLQTRYPVIQVYDNTDSVIIPQSITAVDNNTTTITFSSARTGTAVASKGGYVGSVVTSATTATSATSASVAVTASYAISASAAATTFSIGAAVETYGSYINTIAGANTIISTPTGSYSGAFYKYVAVSGSNARAGEVMAIWNNTTVQFTDVTTNDIGSTTMVTSSVSLSAGSAVLSFTTNTNNWNIKTFVTYL
jgi:hypothetical protein